MEIHFPPNHDPATARRVAISPCSLRRTRASTIPQDIDTSVVAYLLFNPAFSPDDAKDEQVDAWRHIKPGLAPAIVFFGTEDPWKPGSPAEKDLFRPRDRGDKWDLPRFLALVQFAP